MTVCFYINDYGEFCLKSIQEIESRNSRHAIKILFISSSW